MLLEIRDLTAYYGRIRALDKVNLDVEAGEVVALIGANGAGKSTTLKAISGLVPITQGEVLFQGTRLNKKRPWDIVSLGISHAPEGRQVFTRLTVLENLELGAYQVKDRQQIDRGVRRAFELFPVLKERQKQNAGTLSGGEQQMLAIGRALMSSPKLLLLDEPSLGLAPLLVAQIFDIIREIHAAGTTILLVEQNATMALEAADRAFVLETGGISLSGQASQLAADENVQRAYLGIE